MEKSISLSKKGQVGNLAPAIISLVFAAILLVFGLVITQNTTNTIKNVDLSVINESKIVTCLNGTGCYLDTYTVCNFNSPSIYGIVNASNNVAIGTGNATVSSAGWVTNASTALAYATKISYTYKWGDVACLSGNKTVVGLGTFADFWEIIVLAIVITVVIGLLLVVFGERKAR